MPSAFCRADRVISAIEWLGGRSAGVAMMSASRRITAAIPEAAPRRSSVRSERFSIAASIRFVGLHDRTKARRICPLPRCRTCPLPKGGSSAGPVSAFRPMTGPRRRVTVRGVSWFQTVRRLIERHPFASDAALAVALAAFVLSDVWTSGDYFTASKAIYVPAGLLMTLPLAWRRRAPLAVVAVVMGALAFESLAVGSAPTPDSPLVAWLLAIYSVAAHCDRVPALVGGGMSLAAGLVWIGLDDFFLPFVVFGGLWLAGRMVRQRETHARVVEERTAALDRERAANARVSAAEERARIARELHDVLSHSVSVMVVQAGAERMALGSDRAATGERRWRRSRGQVGRHSERCGDCWECFVWETSHPPMRPSRRSPTSTGSSRTCARRGFPSSFRSRATRLRFRRASRSPPIASCRRRSPTCSSTPGRRRRGWSCGMRTASSSSRSQMTGKVPVT